MNVVVFGASGGVGRLLVREVLDRGHRVTAVLRTPSKLALAHEALRVVPGDVCEAATVQRGLEGAEAVLSTVGQLRGSPPDLLGRFAEHLLPALAGSGVGRVVTLVGAGVSWPGDGPPGFGRRGVLLLMKLVARAILVDAQRHADALAAGPVPVVVVRPPRLTDGPRTGRWTAAPYLDLGPGASISRADLAAFMAGQLEDDTFLGRAPMVHG